MPVDPQIRGLLDKGTGVPATHTLPVDVARAQYQARIALMAPPADIADVREQTIDGPGGPLRIRIYTPHGTLLVTRVLSRQRFRPVQPRHP
jgi:acetyl esterase